MANPKSWGRMIRKDISKSKSFASLSLVSRLLFVMLIPHFNGHGKLNGHPAYIKGEIVPLLPEYDLKTIEKCLKEISDKTNVKWFNCNDLMYLQATNWNEHQEINPNKLGRDDLPEYKSCNSLAPVLNELVTKPKPKPNDNDKPKTNTAPVDLKNKIKHKYGEYQNVLLTDKELNELKTQYQNWEYWIKTLDEGIERKGYKYKSHYLAILKWAEKDSSKQKPKYEYMDTPEDKFKHVVIRSGGNQNG